jgi:hypothetical protein
MPRVQRTPQYFSDVFCIAFSFQLYPLSERQATNAHRIRKNRFRPSPSSFLLACARKDRSQKFWAAPLHQI